MAKATSFANDVLDATYNGTASGTVVIGSTTYTYPFRVKFLTTLSTAGTPGTEFSGGSYVQVSGATGGVSLSGNFGTAASAASKTNPSVAITVTNAPAGTWAGNEILDSTGTNKRLVFGPAVSLAKTVNLGDTVTIPVNSLTGTEA